MAEFDFSIMKKLPKYENDLDAAMTEYEQRFGKDSLGRCSTWDLNMTPAQLAQLYRNCIASGKEIDEYLGRGGYTGDDDL